MSSEDTFTMPASWRRQVHPRRGGVERSIAAPVADAEEQVAARLAQDADWVREMLTAPGSDPRLVRAVGEHLNGDHNPLGAGALAVVTMHHALPREVFPDAWVSAFGLPFAARAAVEAFEVEAYWSQYGSQRNDPRLGFRGPAEDVDGYWARPCFADRVRALLAQADEADYRATVEALAGHRGGARGRIVTAYLAPSETAWVEDCCADPAVHGTTDPVLRSMLLCSLGSPEQLAEVGLRTGFRYDGWSMPVIATLAEGLGAAIAPMLEEALKHAYGAEQLQTFAGALVELPSDEAFALLLARLDTWNLRSLLQAAMRRYPQRALRLLGPVAAAAPQASITAQLFATHVRTHAEVATAALGTLPKEVAALVEPLLSGLERVPDAPVEALPPLLVDPPWARRRKARKGRVLAEPLPAPEPRLVWLPGEEKQWDAFQRGYSRWRIIKDWEQPLADLLGNGFEAKNVAEADLFLYGPAEPLRPLLAAWDPTDLWQGEACLSPVVVRHGLDALPLLVRASGRQPATLGQLLLPFLDVDVAARMADWLGRLKSAGLHARDWLLRHGSAAVPYLLPAVVGPLGAARAQAEQALLLLVSEHGPAAALDAAAAHGSEVRSIVAELLDTDPLETALPVRMPVPGPWADPAALPQILLNDGGALPSDAVSRVITVLALCKPGETYPGLAQITAGCDPDSLAAFAWDLFGAWRLAGMPAKESWALNALGLLGDDDTVRRLAPVIRAWPGESAHHRAVEGLDVLAAIGTDTALSQLHGIAQRVPFKALKARAQEKIAEIAEGLGLTGDQLSDRLVPDLGLDADGSTVIDYGPRRFTVGFDEQLRPYVLDQDGRRRKDLPAPNAKDDPDRAPAERKRFAALKKDVRTIAADQVHRLETAMVTQRTWTTTEFQQLFVQHPLTGHLTSRLVWLAEHDGTSTAFRIAEDHSYADADDDTLTLPENATITLAHPLHLGDTLPTWAELFADYEILQPFPQLGRPVHTLTDQEAQDNQLTRFEGVTVPVGKILGLQRHGWERGEPLDNGVERWISKRLAADVYLVAALDPGVSVGIVAESPEQTLRTLWLDSRPDDHWSSRGYPLRLGGLDPLVASELLADLTELTGGPA